MKGFLQEILEEKEREVAQRKRVVPLAAILESPNFLRKPLSLSGALRKADFGVIAELKKASPSRGVIRPDFDPMIIAGQYARGGADALSILTDEKFFQGKLEFISQARELISLPILRKDFLIDPYQVYESRGAGADAVLLIAAALDRARLHELKVLCEELGMEALVEVHNEAELDSVRGLGPSLIGVNNRDLSSFETDIRTSFRLRPLMPPDAACVSESGIRGADDLRALRGEGFHGVLIGETLMRQPDPGRALQEMLRDMRGTGR
jgi:indole-3-glycerol phosphate synthase